MAIVSYERLANITSYIPKTITRCGTIEDFVGASLSKNWDQHTMKNYDNLSLNDYYGPHWISNKYCEEYICLNTLTEIDNYLNKYGYLAVILDFCQFDHCFIICQTEQGQVICDAYACIHPVEIRPFNLHETLASLISTPTINNWNRIWGSKHKDREHSSSSIISIDISYYDVNTNEAGYVNGVQRY